MLIQHTQFYLRTRYILNVFCMRGMRGSTLSHIHLLLLIQFLCHDRQSFSVILSVTDTCNYHDCSMSLIKIVSIENSLVLTLIELFRELLHISSKRTDCFAWNMCRILTYKIFFQEYIYSLNMLNTFPMYLCSISKYSLETTQKL